MDNNKRLTKVKIYGVEYPILSEDPPEYILSIASKVDSAMRELAEGGVTAQPGLAVLAALNLVDDLTKNTTESEDCDNLREQLILYSKENDRLQAQIADLKSSNQQLRAQLEKLSARQNPRQ